MSFSGTYLVNGDGFHDCVIEIICHIQKNVGKYQMKINRETKLIIRLEYSEEKICVIIL